MISRWRVVLMLIARILLITAPSVGNACQAQLDSDPVTVVSHIDIIPDAYKPRSEETAGELLRRQAAETQHDAGLVSFVVLQQNGASNHFTIVETWRDSRSYEKHQGSHHTVEFRNEIQPYLGGPFDTRSHHPFR